MRCDRGWILFGHGLRCFGVSPSVLRWFRATRTDFLLWNWAQFVAPEYQPQFRSLANAIQRGEIPLLMRTCLLSQDDRRLHLHVRFLWRRFGDGAIDTVIARLTRDRRAEYGDAIGQAGLVAAAGTRD